MRVLGLVVLMGVLWLPQLAAAQPGATPVQPIQPEPPSAGRWDQPPPSPPPLPPSCGSCAVAGASYYPATAMLTADEHRLLLRGEISTGQYIGGGVLSIVAGFGVGHAVQGRWREHGWVFTVGESVATTAMFVGAVQIMGCGLSHDSDTRCDTDNGAAVLMAGFIGYTAFRIWELVDVFAAPPAHNRRVRALQLRLGIAPRYSRLRPYLAPTREGGAMAGLTARF